MKTVTKPLGMTIMISLLILLFNFTNHATTANYIGLSILLLLLTLFIHELGHVLFGIWTGYRFNNMTVGPVTIENTERVLIKVNDSWFLFGGVASCSPLTSDLKTIANQHKRFVAGGPIFSIGVAIISFIIGTFVNFDFITYFGVFNLLIFVVTILPYNGAMKSDGRVLLELSKRGKKTEEFLISLLLMKEMNSPLHPKEWSSELIERARTLQPTVDNLMVAYLLFYHTLLIEGYKKASHVLQPFKQIPLTNQNRVILQFITHIKQLDLIMAGDLDIETIKNLHQSMNPLEPLSYKRSQAIVFSLEGNKQKAQKTLEEIKYYFENRKKLFGFFYAEEYLTELLQTKLVSIERYEEHTKNASR